MATSKFKTCIFIVNLFQRHRETIEILEPQCVRDEMKNIISKMSSLYG